jgi:hypothetical protein
MPVWFIFVIGHLQLNFGFYAAAAAEVDYSNANCPVASCF